MGVGQEQHRIMVGAEEGKLEVSTAHPALLGPVSKREEWGGEGMLLTQGEL